MVLVSIGAGLLLFGLFAWATYPGDMFKPPSFTIQTTYEGRYRVVANNDVTHPCPFEPFNKEYKTYKAAQKALDTYLEKHKFEAKIVYEIKV